MKSSFLFCNSDRVTGSCKTIYFSLYISTFHLNFPMIVSCVTAGYRSTTRKLPLAQSPCTCFTCMHVCVQLFAISSPMETHVSTTSEYADGFPSTRLPPAARQGHSHPPPQAYGFKSIFTALMHSEPCTPWGWGGQEVLFEMRKREHRAIKCLPVAPQWQSKAQSPALRPATGS